MGEGLFRRLETTSNELDPDFGRSSLRLSRFVCPKLGDLKKEKVFSQAKTLFSGRNHIKSLINSHRQFQWGRGAIFVLGAKIGLKSTKNVVFCILFRPMGGGGDSPPGYATEVNEAEISNFPSFTVKLTLHLCVCVF